MSNSNNPPALRDVIRITKYMCPYCHQVYEDKPAAEACRDKGPMPAPTYHAGDLFISPPTQNRSDTWHIHIVRVYLGKRIHKVKYELRIWTNNYPNAKSYQWGESLFAETLKNQGYTRTYSAE